MKWARLGELAEFINGFPFAPLDWTEAGLPIIRIQNLTNPLAPINRTRREVDDKFRVHRGELLVSWSATLGVFEWAQSDVGLVNQHIFRVVPREVVDKRFLFHQLQNALVSMGRHLHGATMQHVNRGEFLNTEIPLPELAEQRRIAAILDQADALRAKRRQVLAHLDALTQSIFHDMFGQGRTAWCSAPLSALSPRIDNGTSPVCEARPAGPDEWGVLKLGAVTYGDFRPSENKAYLHDVTSMLGNEVMPGDVLMTRKNTRDLVGAVAVVGDDVRSKLLIPDLVFRLHLDREKVDSKYFQAFMMTPPIREAVRGLASGSAASMPNISKARLSSLQVALPPLALQRQFAARATQVARQQAVARRGLVQLDALFASLQSRAFRGEL